MEQGWKIAMLGKDGLEVVHRDFSHPTPAPPVLASGTVGPMYSVRIGQ